MSKYTTELRFVCETLAGLSESEGFNSIDDIITESLFKLFDFDFPIFDESYRTILERKIVSHYWTREIGYETVGRWKLSLKNKLNEIMPYYNKLYNSELLEFNPLYTHNITKTGHKTSDGNKTENINASIGDTESRNSTVRNTGTDYDLHSDTPQGALTGVDNESYLSSADKSIEDKTRQENAGMNRQHNESKGMTGTANNVDDYLETVVGYENRNPSKSLQEYRATFLNIDMMIIDELNKLFMCIW